MTLRKYSDVVQITDTSNILKNALSDAHELPFVYVYVVGISKACDLRTKK